jgi:hypothetical protein
MNSGQPTAGTARFARAVPILLVAAACLFNAVAYQTELLDAAPDVNDDVFHFGLIKHISAAWDSGDDPLDTWVGDWGQGFPVLRYYQHLPHLAVVLCHRLLGRTVSLHTVFDGMTLLLIVLMPLAFYAGCRLLGAQRVTAACVALLVPLLGADPSQHHFLGFQARSFLWSGGGLFTQLAAMVLLPLALGATSRAALEGRRYAPAVALLGATWLSHLVLGYVACLLSLVVALRPEASGQRLRVLLRLGLVFAGVAVVAAYLLVPSLIESRWLARSIWEPAEYWDSYGARRVLVSLVTGDLLDGRRLPVITLLAGAGVALAVRVMRRDRRGGEAGFAVAALGTFVLGLLLYFGRPTWGPLLGLLPFSGNLPWHRLICAVQFGGVLLAGFALSRLAMLRRWLPARMHVAGVAAAALALLAPAIAATVTGALQDTRWRREAGARDAAVRSTLEAAFADFRSLDAATPGRGYAGTSWDWGRKFEFGGGPVYHRWSGEGLPAISYMYHTMGLCSDLEPSFDPRRRDHYELFDVRYLLAPDWTRLPAFASRRLAASGLVSGLVDTQGYFGVVGSAAFYAYRSGQSVQLRAMNRAFITGRWHGSRRFVRIGWQDGDAPTTGEMLIATDADHAFDRAPDGKAPGGRVLTSNGRGDHYQARVRLDDPGFVLFRMTFHPNWHARIDGRPAPIAMLSPGYVGIAASPGEHAIEMDYVSPGWTRALRWAGPLLLALVLAADLRRGARSRARTFETD